jgi:hypothetical protein
MLHGSVGGSVGEYGRAGGKGNDSMSFESSVSSSDKISTSDNRVGS